jgi:hypothetical protein
VSALRDLVEFIVLPFRLRSEEVRPPRMGRGRRVFWWVASKCYRRHPAGYAECRFCRRELGNQLGHPRRCPVRWLGHLGWALRYCPSWGGADAPYWNPDYLKETE